MLFAAFLSAFLLILSHLVPSEFLHFNVLVRHADVMAINDDETDDEADYLLIALAKARLSRRVTRLGEFSPSLLLLFRAVLLWINFRDIFRIDILYRNSL